MPFLWEVADEGHMVLSGYAGNAPKTLDVPTMMRGLPVKRIGPHALEGQKKVRSIILPSSIESLGGFCFYFCDDLRILKLWDGVVDFNDGAIRQCGMLSEIEIRMSKGNYRLPARFLTDREDTIRLRLLDGEGRLMYLLTFPDFSNNYREDTMARAIHPDIEGVGFSYRACIGSGGVDIRGYDALFPKALALAGETALHIAIGRLMAPTGLSKASADEYRSFIKGNLVGAVDLMFSQMADETLCDVALDGLRFLSDSFEFSHDALDLGLRRATEMGLTEAAGLLMGNRVSKIKSFALTL